MITITSGSYKGRTIVRPETDLTRPVSEQTRHAIFQVLGDIEGLTVLDIFAGSGALGFEAMSLGAKQCTFVDSSAKAFKAISTTIKILKLDDRAILKKDKAYDFLKNNKSKFNLIFLDPPYSDFNIEILPTLIPNLANGGIIIASCSSDTDLEVTPSELELVKIKKYGDTQIGFFRKKTNTV